MKKSKQQNWSKGDIFLVPLSDGTFSVGQVISNIFRSHDSVICAYLLTRVENERIKPILDKDKTVAMLLTTCDLLDAGTWSIVGHEPPILNPNNFNLEHLSTGDFVGVDIIGSGVVMKFMEACFGLYPWDGFYKKNFLDSLLLSPDKKPKGVVCNN